MPAAMPTWRAIIGRALHPPLRDRRFWVVQALILGIAVGHLALDLGRPRLPLGTPDFTTVALFLIPVIYAALRFGLSGSSASAAWGTLLMMPDLLAVDSRTDLWADGTILVVVCVVAVAVGQRVEREAIARQRATAALQAHSAAEARYRALFESSSAPTLVVDGAGVVREANPAAQACFGPRIGRRRLADLVGDGAARQLLAQTPPKMLAVATPGGPVRALRPLSALVTDRGGDLLLQIVLQDVTEEQERQRRTAAYATQVLRVQEEERRRIAQDLHDEPLQTLIYLLRRLETVAQARGLARAARAELGSIRQTLADVAHDLRELAHGLRPPGLDDLGLIASLRRLTSDFTERAHVGVDLRLRGGERPLMPDAASGVFRIVQEALRNVERHAGAGRVTIGLRYTSRAVHLLVVDDGEGFAAAPTTPGLGIRGMQERAALLGGSLAIVSRPGRGTSLRLRVPLAGDGEPASPPGPTAGPDRRLTARGTVLAHLGVQHG